MLESVYQDALAFVGSVRLLSWATQDTHTATFYPYSSLVQQGFGNFIVVDNFKETEEADVNIVVLIESFVDSR